MNMNTMTTDNQININVNTDYCPTLNDLKKYVGKSKKPVSVQGVDEQWYLLTLDGNELIAKPEQPKSKTLEHLTMTDGYIGGMGMTWKTPTADELEIAIQGAMEIEGVSRGEIELLLEAGSVRWCKSPNYYYDHSYGKIGRKRAAKPVQLVECDCGHSVPVGQRMSASLGTSCPDCYDRMS